ncbi:hypothetical protein NFI96_003611 [Prochilodus magdalenae]|nr:hypothetical protein NFI96_003611 [Prochilodus magdalenae]
MREGLVWDLGVVRESSNRKGMISASPEDGQWSVFLRNKTEYTALDSPSVRLSLKQAPQKVGVFVDYEEGLVSFYDVEARSHIYSFTGQSFNEKIYPVFSPCTNEGGQVSRWASQWYHSFILQELPTYSRHMRPGIVVHQEEPRTHCTSVGSDSGSEDFILMPSSSQGAVV